MSYQAGILAVDGTRSPSHRDLCESLQRNDFTRVRHDRDPAQLVKPLAHIALVTNLDRVALAAFD